MLRLWPKHRGVPERYFALAMVVWALDAAAWAVFRSVAAMPCIS